tara:strand:+ start:2259 stop:4091 length:1833 start_codon:yes stop_codon:yes gene_type:complete
MAIADTLLIKIKADTADIKTKLKTLEKDLAKVDKNAAKAGGGVSKLGTSFKGAAKLAGAFGLTMGAMEMGRFIQDATKMGLEMDGLSSSFETLTDSAGVLSDKLLTDLREASQNTISDFELIKNANKAMLLGIDPEALPDLMKAAETAADSLGITATQAFDDITTGVGRASKLILDNLGIVFSTKEAYEIYAATLGKSASELTGVEQKSAILLATQKALRDNEIRLAKTTLTTADQFAQLTTRVQNAKVALGEEFAETIVAFAEILGLVDSKTRDVSDEMVNFQETLNMTAPLIGEQTNMTIDFDASMVSLRQGVANATSSVSSFSIQMEETIEYIDPATGAVTTFNNAMFELNETELKGNEIRSDGNIRLEKQISLMLQRIHTAQQFGQDVTKEKAQLEELIASRGKESAVVAGVLKHQHEERHGKKAAVLQSKNEFVPSIQAEEEALKKESAELNIRNNELNKTAQAMANITAVGLQLEAHSPFEFTIIQHLIKDFGQTGGAIAIAIRQAGGVLRAQGGIRVPGAGTGDKVPAMLEPGEYVLNRRAVDAIGVRTLNNLNFNTAPRFQAGGGVGMGAGTINVFIDELNGGDATSIAEALQEQLQDLINT